MESQMSRDMNLLVVTALDGYAHNHGISTHDAAKVFERNELFALIRSQYAVLHTLALEESIQFVEDVLAQRFAHPAQD
jgi:hypothetical protein